MGTKKPGYRSSRAVTVGADNGARTRDPNLGKVVLYQLSHVRAQESIIRKPVFRATPFLKKIQRTIFYSRKARRTTLLCQ